MKGCINLKKMYQYKTKQLRAPLTSVTKKKEHLSLNEWTIFTSSILNQTSSCLCSRDHLLLSCDYSSDIWSLVFLRISGTLEMFMNWSELLAWIRSNQANNYNVNTISAFAATMGWKHRLLPRKMVTQACRVSYLETE